MQLTKQQIAKIDDPLLQEALSQSLPDEEISAILVLEAKLPASNNQLVPSQFPTTLAYRQALLEQRQRQMAEALGNTIKSLQNLSLVTHSDTISPLVVVQGSADAIAQSLEVSGVRYAVFDKLIGLPNIAPDEAVKHFADLYINTLDRSLDQNSTQLISQASQQYIINYYKRHNKLQILGMQKPVDLDSIYTAVQCLPPSDIWRFESTEALEELYRQAGKRGLQARETDKQDGIKVADQQQYLMVLGAPGAGKSTFLRKIGLEALKGNRSNFQHECIPVFIELKQFSDKTISLEAAIRKEFQSCQLPFFEEFTTKALQQGNLLILLDGLDEVPTDNMDLAISQIQNFVDEYQENRLIASCRTAAYRRNFQQFYEVAIADFDDAQIHTFIQNWFSSEVDRKVETAEKCWELINAQESTKELARTPLLLTFLCLVYDASQDLPEKRATLYSKALDILLERWAAEKRLPGDHISRVLDIELEKIMLSEIAYQGFKADKLFVDRQEVVSQIKEFIASNDNAPKNLDAESILDAIAIQQGILVERARNVYSFSHLTLQEYLTAKYIDNHRQVEKLVSEHLTDQRWKEVFLLVAGLMHGGADELLLLIEKESQKYINTQKLQALLRWAEQATSGSAGNSKPVGKRAVAIANANANAIKSARELEKLEIFNNVNFNVLIARLEALEAEVPDDKKSLKVRRKFVERLQQTWLNAFNLSPEMVNLSEEEAKALENYLYANLLIIQCKQAAVQVSSKIWEAIEERMLGTSRK